MARSQGHVILLVGPSCAGKSTLARAIQTLSAESYLIQSLDGLFAAIPEAYGSGGEQALQGFRYELSPAARIDEPDVRRIAYGPVGRRLLEGFHRAVAAYARAGVDVVVDDMLLDLEVFEDWSVALAGVPTFLVGVTAAKAELLERERARIRRSTPGLVEGHFDLHRSIAVDLEIDTSVLDPSQAASRVLSLVAGG